MTNNVLLHRSLQSLIFFILLLSGVLVASYLWHSLSGRDEETDSLQIKATVSIEDIESLQLKYCFPNSLSVTAADPEKRLKFIWGKLMTLSEIFARGLDEADANRLMNQCRSASLESHQLLVRIRILAAVGNAELYKSELRSLYSSSDLPIGIAIDEGEIISQFLQTQD
ncbi:MAG: hypothetical protein NUW37_16540 [Planctomycetes bacterium]|nr:hypothetical protein [Planctomycetota bacterium]